MDCLINQTIDQHAKRGRKLEVIGRYIRLKYHVHIENSALIKRLELLK